MGIADKIAAKRRELAQFVTESASAVIAEDMTDAMRGAAALDLLKLMVASGLAAAAGPTIDVTPSPAALVDPEWTPRPFKMTFPPSQAKVQRERRARLAGTAGDTTVDPAPVVAPKTRGPGVPWTPANVERLRTMATQSPRPSAVEIAEAFGTTPNAIQTAMSRFGITKGVSGAKPGELKDLSSFQRRDCMSCSRPFLSEGNHNRLCSKCTSGDRMECAA